VELEQQGIAVRVVSMPSTDVFDVRMQRTKLPYWAKVCHVLRSKLA
jgi:transketolase